MTEHDRSVVHDSFTLERSYPVAPQRLFAAWSDPAAKAAWFVGAGESEGAIAPGSTHELDFRVGGRESFAATLTGGGEVTFDAVYHDIVDGERIVYSYDMHLRGRRLSVSVATVEILPEPGGARLVLTEQGVYLDGLDTAAARREGTALQLELIARTVA